MKFGDAGNEEGMKEMEKYGEHGQKEATKGSTGGMYPLWPYHLQHSCSGEMRNLKSQGSTTGRMSAMGFIPVHLHTFSRPNSLHHIRNMTNEKH